MRKALAGALIRLAHRIYRPRVTNHTINFHGPIKVEDLDRLILQGEAVRRESRGWN